MAPTITKSITKPHNILGSMEHHVEEVLAPGSLGGQPAGLEHPGIRQNATVLPFHPHGPARGLLSHETLLSGLKSSLIPDLLFGIVHVPSTHHSAAGATMRPA
eukprot:CAMPEP_0181339762 /NCGR_PEP_ID=MMETSP1101-20121128/29460_1 /TAXON_ID=46948 /ORGANISM="Rhodomonas abbreviata, Strain Caron Lab Isolate" /LENGTH=102 /DNA_ID=CAMNT_0023450815 /DNA_START=210 /DNA_END=515 /DNA_ORIENTATION=+